jgi:hypothetical protein
MRCDGRRMARRLDLTHPDLAHLLRFVQDGVVSRRQLRRFGATDKDIERLVRRRELTRVHRGVFVDHTGALTRQQREWVAVLAAWPAALARESALPDPPTRIVHIAVHRGRTVSVPAWVIVHHCAHLDRRAHTRASPPRMTLEHAVIDVMADRLSDDDLPAAFRVLTEAAHTRRTDAAAILRALDVRRRVAHRATIRGLLTDLRDGACSVLERGYLHRVERAHGLPPGQRQCRSRATGRTTEIDVRYPAQHVIVEIDGGAFHDGAAARDRDAMRDLAEAAVGGDLTVRVTYGMVFRDQCRTAHRLAALLRRNGWTGTITRCPLCPPSVGTTVLVAPE